MTSMTSPANDTLQIDEKEAKLSNFIRDYLSAGYSEVADSRELLIVALSTDSPVVCAVKSVMKEIDAAQAHVRMILATLPEDKPSDHLMALAPIEIRWACNTRLLDAHEQLVVGPMACWMGDCMRRDPRKRDVFESFTTACPEAAGWAHVSFDRLWQASEPLLSLGKDHEVEDHSAALHAALQLRRGRLNASLSERH